MCQANEAMRLALSSPIILNTTGNAAWPILRSKQAVIGTNMELTDPDIIPPLSIARQEIALSSELAELKFCRILRNKHSSTPFLIVT